MKTNDDHLNKDKHVNPRSKRGATWQSYSVTVSIMTREDAGVDCNEPWIASCDTHGQMIGCSTKSQAIRAVRSRD